MRRAPAKWRRHNGVSSSATENAHAILKEKVSCASNSPHECSDQSTGWISKTGQRHDANNFQNFALRIPSPTDQPAKFKIPRLFPPYFAFSTALMPATLELNVSPNHLCDSILRHPRNCIDAPRWKSKIELPKPQHVVFARALNTIGCGSWNTPAKLFRVFERF